MHRIRLTYIMLLFTFISAFAQTKYVDLSTLETLGKSTTDTKAPFDRLPSYLEGKIREPLWVLSRNSAGIAVRFRTNSTTIKLKWENINGFSMRHMTDIGVRGFDLYGLMPDGTWHFAGVAWPQSKGSKNESTIVKAMTPEWREFMLYLPLYEGVVKAEIGIDSTASIVKPQTNDPVREKPIVFYGTSILQGGCASRPGMAFTNIIERRLHRECINLGFSGNGQLDLDVARVMAKVDASVFVLDFVPNCSPKQMCDSMMTFYSILRESHPKTPIVFAEDPIFTNTPFNMDMKQEVERKNATIDSIYNIIKSKDRRVQLIKAIDIIGTDGEACVDGIHMTDLGMMRYSMTLTAILTKLIRKH